ncbi:MAG TPA: copper oxidase [Acidobacteria bacterium]|nr:copper oxidase [Acidobacteriota bacterium]
MVQRRDVLKLGLAAAAAPHDPHELLKFLCPPDGEPPDLATPSPPATPFKAELYVPPVMQPVPALQPPPDPKAHQLYDRFPPQKLYELHEQEFRWAYHPDPPYSDGGGSLSWGFNGATPGPVFHARYGEPILVRRFNNLPPVGVSQVTFALPSTSMHLHNGHTASESDGSPQDWIDTGEFWDHHYANFPSGNDPRQKLTSLWYHDHRLDFTAANVYAGLDGFYFLFDDEDTGDETTGWRLPGGKYDVPLILHDVMFQANGQVRWNPFNTAGILGDRYTVNRRIQPFFQVERRKYRFRIYNGGPSRFYQLFLSSGKPFVVLTGDGNFLPEPLLAESLYLSVAQRVDIILDFSEYNVGDTVELVNRLEQTNGQGPSGRMLDPGDPLMQFRVVAATGPDNSRIPDKLRPLPRFDPSSAVRERLWTFDYVGGLWTVNGKVFDPNRIDAGVEIGTTEIWTFRNGGNTWAHPVHCHFTEFIILEINGKPYEPSFIQDWEGGEEKLVPLLGSPTPWRLRKPIHRFMGGPRRDVATLLPGDEIKVIFSFQDFLGHYVMHCHNVVHEDHSMMIRWDVLQPGQGFGGSRPVSAVYGTEVAPPHLEPRPRASTFQQDQQEPKEE